MDPYTKNGQSNSNPTNSKSPKPSFISPAEILAEFSHHDSAVARINNGSFGSCPKSVLAVQSMWQLRFLSQPDDFYVNVLKPSILESRTLIKDLVNADHVEEISLVDNVSTAAAIVFQKIAWAFTERVFEKADVVVMLHHAYGAVKKSLQAYVARAGGRVIEVHLPFTVSSNEEIITEFKKAIKLGNSEGRRVRLAVIDHITAMPSVVIPVKELVKVCREEGVDRVFVDAAHAIGNVEIDVKEIGADFYTSTLYKWFFCPPSVAFLYCKKSTVANDLHHPVVSHEYGNGLAIESGWIGTRDYSAQLVVPSVFEFLKRFEGGIEGIRRRNHEKAVEMGKMLVDSWGTCLGTPEDMCCSMVMVGLPGCLGIESEKDALKLRTHLREEFKVEVPICYDSLKGGPEGGFNGTGSVTGYARISHQVYNVEDDYRRFRDAINKLVKDGFKCAMLSSS